MISIQNFFKAPTQEQRNEIRLLCKKGQSNSYFDCYFQAPLQALTSITMAFKDIPYAPIRGLLNSVTHLCSFSLRNAIITLADGIAIGFRSLFQVAIIASAVTLGFLFPRDVYRNLEKLNSDGIGLERQIINLQQTLRTAEESKIQKKQKFRELQDQLKDKNDELAGLQTNFNHSINLTLQTNEFSQTLKSEIAEKESQLIAIRKELESKTNELDSIAVNTIDRTTTLFEIDCLQKQLKLKDIEINNVQKNLKDLVETYSKDKDFALREFNEKLASAEEENKIIENKLSQVSEELKTARMQSQGQEDIFNDLKIQLSEKTSQIVTQKNDLETLETKLLNLKTVPNENDEAMKVMNEKLSHTEKLCSALRKELQEKNEKINQLTKESVITENKMKKNNDFYVDSQTTQQKLILEIEQKKRHEVSAKKKYDELLKKYSLLEEGYKNTFDELESLKSKSS